MNEALTYNRAICKLKPYQFLKFFSSFGPKRRWSNFSFHFQILKFNKAALI